MGPTYQFYYSSLNYMKLNSLWSLCSERTFFRLSSQSQVPVNTVFYVRFFKIIFYDWNDTYPRKKNICSHTHARTNIMAEIGNPYRSHVANVTGDVPPYFSNTLKDKISCNTGLVVIKLMSTSFSYSKIIQSEVFIYIYIYSVPIGCFANTEQ